MQTAKTKKNYNKNIYDGVFQEDKGRSALPSLMAKPPQTLVPYCDPHSKPPPPTSKNRSQINTVQKTTGRGRRGTQVTGFRGACHALRTACMPSPRTPDPQVGPAKMQDLKLKVMLQRSLTDTLPLGLQFGQLICIFIHISRVSLFLLTRCRESWGGCSQGPVVHQCCFWTWRWGDHLDFGLPALWLG